jgi:hypothetical protein
LLAVALRNVPLPLPPQHVLLVLQVRAVSQARAVTLLPLPSKNAWLMAVPLRIAPLQL